MAIYTPTAPRVWCLECEDGNDPDHEWKWDEGTGEWVCAECGRPEEKEAV